MGLVENQVEDPGGKQEGGRRPNCWGDGDVESVVVVVVGWLMANLREGPENYMEALVALYVDDYGILHDGFRAVVKMNS